MTSRHHTWVVALCACTSAVAADDRIALIDQRPEPAGVHCPAGGTAVLVGADANANGALDDAEVEATTYVCAAPEDIIERVDGDLRIRTASEALRYAHLRTVTGNLRLETRAAVVLPALEEVGPILDCACTGGARVALPMLAHASTVRSQDCELELPRLATLDEHLQIFDNLATTPPAVLPALRTARVVSLQTRGGAPDLPALEAVEQLGVSGPTAIHLPALTEVRMQLSAPDVAQLELPALHTVGTLYIAGANRAVVAPKLRHGFVDATQGSELISLSLPSFEDGGLSIFGNPALVDIDLPAYAASDTFDIRENHALVRLATPALTAARTLVITNNPLLPTCMATALADQTGAPSTISGNGTGSCP